MKLEHTIDARARYVECDPMGYVHHSVYPIWFELARTELLRESVGSYAEMERCGLLIVVVKLDVRFHRPARYDDLVQITATLKRSSGVRIEHVYEARRDGLRLASGTTTLACVDRTGQLQPVPESLRHESAQ